MPPLHRLFTDFAISAVIISFIFEVISRIFRKSKMHGSAVIVVIAGTLVTIPCIITGLHDAKLVFTVDPVYEVMMWHRGLAFVLVGMMVGLVVWGVWDKGLRKGSYLPFSPPEADKFPQRSTGEGKVPPPMFLIALLVVVVLMGVTGYLGEKMVYKYGAGKPLPAAVGIPNWGIQASRGYRCPVHHNLTSANPGLCPKCGVRMIPIMDLPNPKAMKKKGK